MDKIINDGSIDLTLDRIFSREKRKTVDIDIINDDILIHERAFLTNLRNFNFTTTVQLNSFTYKSMSASYLYSTDKSIVPDSLFYVGKDRIKKDILGQYELDPKATSNSYKCPVCGKVNDKLLLNKTGNSITLIICDKCIEKVPHIFTYRVDENIYSKLAVDRTIQLETFEDRLFYYGLEFNEYVDSASYIRTFLTVNGNVNEYIERPRSTYQRVEHEIEFMLALKDKPDPESNIRL